MKNNNGFTLIELLIVIAIIGILAGVVLVNSKSAVDKANRASALSTASSVIPEIVTCQDDTGGIQAPTNNTAGGGNICSAAGHSVAWPDISRTNWTYNAAADNDIIDGVYNFTLTAPAGSGQSNISCSMANNGCS